MVVGHLIQCAHSRLALEHCEITPFVAVSGALILHQAFLDESSHPCCWSKFFFPMLGPNGAETEASLAMASVFILAMTALPSDEEEYFQQYDYDSVRYGDGDVPTKVNSNLGLSRMMIYFIYLITKPKPSTDANKLLQQISDSPNWVDESESVMPKPLHWPLRKHTD